MDQHLYFGYTAAQLAKAIASGIATIITIVTSVLAIPGIIPTDWLPYIATAVSVLGTIAVAMKGNAPVVSSSAQVDTQPGNGAMNLGHRES